MAGPLRADYASELRSAAAKSTAQAESSLKKAAELEKKREESEDENEKEELKKEIEKQLLQAEAAKAAASRNNAGAEKIDGMSGKDGYKINDKGDVLRADKATAETYVKQQLDNAAKDGASSLDGKGVSSEVAAKTTVNGEQYSGSAKGHEWGDLKYDSAGMTSKNGAPSPSGPSELRSDSLSSNAPENIPAAETTQITDHGDGTVTHQYADGTEFTTLPGENQSPTSAPPSVPSPSQQVMDDYFKSLSKPALQVEPTATPAGPRNAPTNTEKGSRFISNGVEYEQIGPKQPFNDPNYRGKTQSYAVPVKLRNGITGKFTRSGRFIPD